MAPIKLTRPLTPELARAIYACMVAGADVNPNPIEVEDFIAEVREGNREWNMGFFKLWIEGQSIWLECHREDRNDSRQRTIDRTMRALAVLMGGEGK